MRDWRRFSEDGSKIGVYKEVTLLIVTVLVLHFRKPTFSHIVLWLIFTI